MGQAPSNAISPDEFHRRMEKRGYVCELDPSLPALEIWRHTNTGRVLPLTKAKSLSPQALFKYLKEAES